MHARLHCAMGALKGSPGGMPAEGEASLRTGEGICKVCASLEEPAHLSQVVE